MVTLSLIKEASIYSGEKTVSSISGVGKIGYLYAKKANKNFTWYLAPDKKVVLHKSQT